MQLVKLTSKLTAKTKTLYTKKITKVYANHIVFSINGLKSIFVVWTSSNVTTTSSSISASSKSELKQDFHETSFSQTKEKLTQQYFVVHLPFDLRNPDWDHAKHIVLHNEPVREQIQLLCSEHQYDTDNIYKHTTLFE